MFVGQFDFKLDKKKRLVIPSKFRPSLSEISVQSEANLFVTLKTVEYENITASFLSICTTKEWDKQMEWLSEQAKRNQQAAWYFRKISSDTELCKLDAQWRILLPTRLIKSAYLKRDIMIVGNGDNIEVWDLEKWSQVSTVLDSQIPLLEKSIYNSEK